MEGLIILIVIVGGILLSFLREVKQYERGVVLTMGKYTGLRNPGWSIIVPIFQSMQKVDLRVKAVDVPDQKVITRDNVSASINAVIYYKVSDAARATLEVENFRYAVSQLAQTTMRNIVGGAELDEVLANREELSNKIR
ncbi:MAG: regulator of protease activity HflC (stomatin/prohibitin superfamily), partial [Candidatus Paceibacteria bacterium]